MIPLLLLLAGLFILVVGAEILVRGSSSIAARLGMSDLLIGLTVVAFGTSAPELAVSIKAALADQGGIALGNVIGSNIFNASLILGLTALICPLAVSLQAVRRELPILLPVTVLFAAMVYFQGGLNRFSGLVLLLGLGVYLWTSFRRGAVAEEEEAAVVESHGQIHPALSIGFVLAGLAMLVFGARIFVNEAVEIATLWGVSESVIGLTIVAAGTSLPELATSVVAAIRGRADMAVGNILGSNLFNLLAIAGLSSVVRPLVAPGLSGVDLGVMIVTSAILLPFFRTGFRLSRWEGLVLLLGFSGYLAWVWPK